MVFLDIKGAFDTICPEHIKNSLKAKGINKDLIEWYYNYIKYRNIEFKDNSFEITGKIDTGFPQLVQVAVVVHAKACTNSL